MHQENEGDETAFHTVRIKGLFSDYDGTISDIEVSRDESHVHEKTRLVLERMSRLIPIVIVSTKDLSFLVPRTSFAHAWCGVAGIENRIGNRIQASCLPADALERVALALKFAKSNVTDAGMLVEEKRNSYGRTVAFCVDWRQTEDKETVGRRVNEISSYCRKLNLELIRCAGQPFLDVYPVPVDKGKAVRKIREELKLKDGTLYMGDSEIDNSAFDACDISVGVVHDYTAGQNLVSRYLVESSETAAFLNALLANHLIFDPSIPMIRSNPPRVDEN